MLVRLLFCIAIFNFIGSASAELTAKKLPIGKYLKQLQSDSEDGSDLKPALRTLRNYILEGSKKRTDAEEVLAQVVESVKPLDPSEQKEVIVAYGRYLKKGIAPLELSNLLRTLNVLKEAVAEQLSIDPKDIYYKPISSELPSGIDLCDSETILGDCDAYGIFQKSTEEMLLGITRERAGFGEAILFVDCMGISKISDFYIKHVVPRLDKENGHSQFCQLGHGYSVGTGESLVVNPILSAVYSRYLTPDSDCGHLNAQFIGGPVQSCKAEAKDKALVIGLSVGGAVVGIALVGACCFFKDEVGDLLSGCCGDAVGGVCDGLSNCCWGIWGGIQRGWNSVTNCVRAACGCRRPADGGHGNDVEMN